MTMRIKPLLKPHKQILQVLTEQNELAQYDMAKQLSISYRTILRRTKELEKSNPPLIKFVREEPSEKGGKNRNIYTLTLNGLFYALKNPKLWNRIDKIVEYHKNKLLIFECWNLLTESEKQVVISAIMSKYDLNKYSFLGTALNLDALALMSSEQNIKELVDALFTGMVVPKELRPILERIDKLKEARRQALQKELADSEKVKSSLQKEIKELED